MGVVVGSVSQGSKHRRVIGSLSRVSTEWRRLEPIPFIRVSRGSDGRRGPSVPFLGVSRGSDSGRGPSVSLSFGFGFAFRLRLRLRRGRRETRRDQPHEVLRREAARTVDEALSLPILRLCLGTQLRALTREVSLPGFELDEARLGRVWDVREGRARSSERVGRNDGVSCCTVRGGGGGGGGGGGRRWTTCAVRDVSLGGGREGGDSVKSHCGDTAAVSTRRTGSKEMQRTC